MDLFLDTFWTHVRFLFVTKRISGAHWVPLWAPTETSLLPSGIRQGSLLALRTFAPSWALFATHGVSFEGRVAPIRSLSKWLHCLLSGAFNHGFGA